ncbi:MAG: chromosome partitioning protein ParA [Cyanobacteria bacterium J06592_8]
MNLSALDTQKSSVLILTGMHRSGTSLATALLQSAGLHIGRQLLEGNSANLKGYFENVEFVKFHQAVLQSHEINSDGWTLQEQIDVEEQYVDQAREIIDQNAISAIWGWKDPRTSLFLKFWANLLPEANFLLVYRSPWEVIDSLYRRGDEVFHTQPELAVKVWLHYNHQIINFYNHFSSRCILANIGAIVQEPQRYIETVNQKFKIQLGSPTEAFYESSLLQTYNQDSHRPTVIDYYFPEAIELYQELEARSWQPDENLDLSWRDRIKSSPYRVWVFKDWMDLRRVESLQTTLQSDYETLKAESEQLKSQLSQTQEELEKSQSQLSQTQEDLEKSQSQLQETEAAKNQAETQLSQTRTELTQIQAQLSQTQEELEKSQSQLSETEKEKIKSQTQLDQVQTELTQTQSQFSQVQKEVKHYQTQYLELEKVSNHSKIQLNQAQSELHKTQSQLYYTQEELEQSESQLHQTTTVLEQSLTRLHQTEKVLEECYSQYRKAQNEGKKNQVKLYQTQDKLQQTQEELKQAQNELNRREFIDAIAGQPNESYQQLVWEAWFAYRNNDLALMARNLRKAMKQKPFSQTETLLNWLESFAKFSSEQGESLDTQTLTNSPEWKQLIRQTISRKSIAARKLSVQQPVSF